MLSDAYVVSVEFDQATSYALERLKNPEINLKLDQVKAIRHVYGGKDVCCVAPYRVWKEYLLPLMFDYRKSKELYTAVNLYQE